MFCLSGHEPCFLGLPMAAFVSLAFYLCVYWLEEIKSVKQIFPNHAICAVSSQTHFCVFSFAWLPAVFSQQVILFGVWFIAHQAFYLVRQCFTLGHLGWVIQVNGVWQPHDKDSVEQELKKAMEPCTELCLSQNVAFPGANKLIIPFINNSFSFFPFINNWNAKLLKCEVIDLAILYWAANVRVFSF